MSGTKGMLLFWLATFDQWTMSQFRFPVIKAVVIVMSRCHGAKKTKTTKKKNPYVNHAFVFSQGHDLLLSITQNVPSNEN